ncbi:hypothetical protein KM043_018829, partial [Ampulex compressa]
SLLVARVGGKPKSFLLRPGGAQAAGLTTRLHEDSSVTNSEDEASDGRAVPGPTRSLRPRRPRLGTNVDNNAISPAKVVILTPFLRRTCTVCSSAGRGNILFLRYVDELRHLEEVHPQSRLVFRCRTCLKNFDRRHAADCHRPRCPGAPPAEEGRQCEYCEKSFATGRGLTQHLRLKHPAVRNEQRRIAAEVPRAPRAPRPGKAWTEQELKQLHELEERFRHENRIAKAISGVLLTKTVKQIRDKRAEIRCKMLRQRRVPTIQSVDIGQDNETAPVPLSDSDSDDNWEDAVQELPLQSTLMEDQTAVNETGSVEQNNVIQWIEEMVCHAKSENNENPQGSTEVIKALNALLDQVVAQSGNIPQNEIDRIYEMAVSSFPSGNDKRKQAKRRGTGKRARRRYIYAKTQDLYNKNPGLLAKYVRKGVDFWIAGIQSLDAHDVREMYQKLWGTIPEIQPPQFGNHEPPIALSDTLTSITIEDVKGRIAKVKAGTAPGLDGIRKNQILTRGATNTLRKLFNLFMVTGKQPTAWGKNRTILIPKEGKDPAQISNYRPLTISSLLCRLYWGIIDTKLRKKIKGTARQKGFVAERGCYNNVHILNEILAHSKVKGGLVAVQLDVSKAFDTIPHQAIGPALRKKGMHERVVQLVCSAYKDVHTNIHCGRDTVPICLQRGVKQGDPLSPLLFNTVLEPLLLKLEEQLGYEIQTGNNISCLAFADDIFLVASNVSRARNLLQITEAYLTALGMAISAPKCASFQVVPTKDSYYIKDPGLRLNGGESVPFANAETRLTYLGINITPWIGIDLGDLRSELNSATRRIKQLALKPHQKTQLLSAYLIPHYVYRLVLGVAPVTYIRALDRDLRVTIKEILHLPPSVSNGILYAGKRDGGLGFPKLETICVSSSLKSGLTFLQSPDPAVQALAQVTGLENKLKSQAKAVRLAWPIISVKEIDKWKADMKKRELEEWGKCVAQGKAVANTKDDRIGNAWLYKPWLLKPGRFLTALRLRTDTAGTRVAMNRATPQLDTKCRKCKTLPETLAHVIGQCTYTKAARIRRHDSIVNLVMAEVHSKDKEAVVMKEPKIKINEGVLKPDLVVKSLGRVFVVDVTVRHEDGDYLDNGRREKIDKYSPLLPHIQKEMGASCGEVLPIVGFGHISRHCKVKLEICGHCGEEGHPFAKCGRIAEAAVCSNCKRAGLPHNHGTRDRNCPKYKAARESAASKSNYG